MRAYYTLLVMFLVLGTQVVKAQLRNKTTYHDKDKHNIKEFYQVSDTLRNILHGRYISYFLNGNIESKGQFTNNETTGVWEFFYETGNLKMRGILRHNSNYGVWEYFYENGQKSMEGTINGKTREGEWKMYYENGQLKDIGSYLQGKHTGSWKTYFEDGALKGEIDYVDDFGRYIEYYHSGKIYGEGPRLGLKNSGHWRYFAEDGTLSHEGEFVNGKKNGEWIHFFPSGKVHSRGMYENDLHEGIWYYFYENGQANKSGEFKAGVRQGEWRSYNENGVLHTTSTFINNEGTYTEYFASGKIRCTGTLKNDKREGKWEFFYESGKKEGDCEYKESHGLYYGYFPDGALQTKGQLEDDRKVGSWEIFERDGKLSGYYKPFYDDKDAAKEIANRATKNYGRTNASHTKGLSYFDPRINEFKGVIIAGNPLFTFIGRFPLAIEFYLQERLGHEFEFVGMRDPFFRADKDIAVSKNFERGYSIAIKQKMYNPLKVGMWYLGHEVRFTNLGHFINIASPLTPDNFFTASSSEQRIAWGGLLGYRIMRKNNAPGFTIDTFVSFNVGYRSFSVDPKYRTNFESIEQSKLLTTFNFGINFGNVFSFK
jgi:uncharacterized protein